MAIKNVVVGSLMYYSDLITASDISSYGTHCPSHNLSVTTRSCSDCSHNSSVQGTTGGCWHYQGNKGTY